MAAKSKPLTNPHQADRLNNRRHTLHQPKTPTERHAFTEFLEKELALGFSDNLEVLADAANGDMETRRSTLQDPREKEATIELALTTVQRHNNVSVLTERLLCENALPCIPHTEMRASEKLFWSLLSMGMFRCQEGKPDAKTRQPFVERVTDCVRDTILGDGKAGNKSSQWNFPLKDDGKQVDPRSMSNSPSGKCLVGLKTLSKSVLSQAFD